MGKLEGIGVPADFVREGIFPNCSFTDDAPSAVHTAAEIARDLKTRMAARNVCRVAAQCGLERSALYAICAGRAWPCMGAEQS